MKNNTISFFTLGCRLNQSETSVLQRTFEVEGYNVVNIEQPADVVVINTCTVTENGDADTRRLVHKISRINSRAKIALIGCQAQVQKEKLTQLPNVRWVVGNGRKMDLVSILKEFENEDLPQVITPTISREAFTMTLAGLDREHTRANLKIQDGCDFFCSFCEIPYARGRARSRQYEDVLLEANALVAAGHKEIVLTGINIGTYQDGGVDFLRLLDVLENIEGLMRIRISSIEPTTIPLSLYDRMKPGSKLCRHLHIPIQSGHDDILKLMKRKYGIHEFSSFIEKGIAKVPGICIGTDVIVGFPGESEGHFENTYELLRDLPFAYFHVFSYSERQMAHSQGFPDPVPALTIQKRSQILRELSDRKRQLFLKSLLGTKQKVLFEQCKNGIWDGLTDHYAKVKVKSNIDLSNQLVEVMLNEIEGQSILGEIHL